MQPVICLSELCDNKYRIQKLLKDAEFEILYILLLSANFEIGHLAQYKYNRYKGEPPDIRISAIDKDVLYPQILGCKVHFYLRYIHTHIIPLIRYI